MENQTEKPKKKFYKKWWFWAIVAVVVIFIIGAGGPQQPQTVNQNSIDDNKTQDAASVKETTTQNVAPKTDQEILELK